MKRLLSAAALSGWKTIEQKPQIFNDRPTGLRKLCNELEQELKEDKMDKDILYVLKEIKNAIYTVAETMNDVNTTLSDIRDNEIVRNRR